MKKRGFNIMRIVYDLFSHPSNCIFMIGVLFSILSFMPLFFSEKSLTNLSSHSISKAIQQSQSVKLCQLFFLISSLPVLVDCILEFVFGNTRSSLAFKERTIISLGLATPNILYCISTKSPYSVYLFQSSQYTMLIMLCSSILSIISKNIKARCWIALILVAQLSFALSLVMSIITNAFPVINVSSIVSTVLLYFSIGISSILVAVWVFEITNDLNYRKLQNYNFEKSVGITYGFVLICQLSTLLIGQKFYNISTWTKSTEEYIVFIYLTNSFFIIILSILQGRFSRSAQMHAQDIIALKRTFVRYISHEIRSPIGVLHAGLELLSKDVNIQLVTQDFAALLNDLCATSQDAVDLLDNLLDYESIDAETFSLNLQNVEVFGIFRGKLDSLRIIARAHELILEIIDPYGLIREVPIESQLSEERLNPGGNVLSSMFNQTHLKVDIPKLCNQVIRNSVSSAAKSCTAKAGKITIAVTVSQDYEAFLKAKRVSEGFIRCQLPVKHTIADIAGFLRVEVQDTGSGVVNNRFSEVFVDFSRFNGNDLHGGGFGIGLWICRKIISLHGGVIDVNLIEGQGSRFSFMLPIFRNNASDVVISLNERIEAGSSGRISRDVELLRTRSQSCDSTAEARAKRSFACSWGMRMPCGIKSKVSDDNIANDSSSSISDHVERGVLSNKSKSVTSTLSRNKISPAPKLLTSQERAQIQSIVQVLPKDLYPPSLQEGNVDFGNFEGSEIVTPSESITLVKEPKYHGLSRIPSFEDHPSSRIRVIRILIVDDSTINRKVLRKSIQAEMPGFQAIVSECVDGQDAIDLFESAPHDGHALDCILLDNIMTHMHGPETVRLLRRKYNYSGLILGVTGNVIASDVEEFKSSGVDNVFIKPLVMSNLITELNHAIMQKTNSF